MNTRTLSFCFLAFTLLFACEQAARSAEKKPTRPNIIFIFTDDHASHAISAYGSKINKTPHIDRLAKEGMLFRNCFVTNSICAPSRAVILTGKHSHLNGQIDNRRTFDGDQQTFPKLLRKAGYQTAMIGKWHLRSAPQGFDFWRVLFGQGPYYNPQFRSPEALTRKQSKRIIGYTTDIITDITLDWLKNKRDKNKPFMLMTQHKAPHREWEPGPRHLTLYDDVKIPEPPTLFDDYANRTSAAKKQTMTIADHMNDRDLKFVPPRGLTPEQLKKWNAAYGPKNKAFREANLKGKELVRWKYQRYIKDYLRCIASVDENIGRLLKYLDETGLSKNTIVIYSSDQGFYLGDHGWYDKRWMYEESLRMPFIVRWPGVTKPGSVNTDLVQNLDFAETFLDIAGAPIPGDMQGKSLVPLLKGKTPADWRKAIYYQYFEYYGPRTVHSVQRHYGVRTKRYKLIHYYLIDEWELFDLQKDPHELKSVYNDPTYQDVVKKLKAELQRLRKKYKVDEFKEPPLDSRSQKRARPGLSLRPDFAMISKGKVPDLSGRGHVGRLTNGKVVKGLHGQAVEFKGKGTITVQPAPGSLNPASTALTVGAWCKPAQGDGVIIAHGGESLGYSLFLKAGQPHFGIRSQGTLYSARGNKKILPGQWAHIVGQLDGKGQVRILVDGQPSGPAVKGTLIASSPADGLSIGADTGSHVANYTTDLSYSGLLEDVRVYFGEVEKSVLLQWGKK